MINRTSPDYSKELLRLRKAKKLHTVVEDRLVELLKEVAPDYHSIKEPQGLVGGRNDLMLFEFSGRSVLFEVFATARQVESDLLILQNTKADVKIAVLIDKDVDGKVVEKYLKKRPEPFPFIFIGELFEDPTENCCCKLGELIFRDKAVLQIADSLDVSPSEQTKDGSPHIAVVVTNRGNIPLFCRAPCLAIYNSSGENINWTSLHWGILA